MDNLIKLNHLNSFLYWLGFRKWKYTDHVAASEEKTYVQKFKKELFSNRIYQWNFEDGKWEEYFEKWG